MILDVGGRKLKRRKNTMKAQKKIAAVSLVKAEESAPVEKAEDVVSSSETKARKSFETLGREEQEEMVRALGVAFMAKAEVLGYRVSVLDKDGNSVVIAAKVRKDTGLDIEAYNYVREHHCLGKVIPSGKIAKAFAMWKGSLELYESNLEKIEAVYGAGKKFFASRARLGTELVKELPSDMKEIG